MEKPIAQMTDEELLELLQNTPHVDGRDLILSELQRRGIWKPRGWPPQLAEQ